MTDEAERLHRWLAKGRQYYDQLALYENGVRRLNGACGTKKIADERDRLRVIVANSRMEVYELLNRAELKPNQFTVLNLHYIQYESWNQIAARMHIARRSAIALHNDGIERIAKQIQIGN